ncbi:centromere protein O-like isoform X2 [Ostrea edulis]|uniref:centromere protein O-like isoform X2 n=1 Tax=Ostrea edulis TaxID=37623 RepID=UPI0024AED01B|nr:centromere protein O-like isoform X2 [Ostrea edulis]
MTDCFGFLEKLEKENVEGTKNDQDLHQKWIHLKSSRDKLQTKLDHLERTEKQLEEEIEAEVRDQKSKPRSEELSERHQYLEDLLSLYRVTGMHVCYEDRNQFTVCLDASYYDTILESYHIELKERDRSYVIHRHSLPEFIPTLQLEREHLATGDIASFLSLINTYLQAYVFKREELVRIKKFIKKSGLSCDVQNTSSYDYTEIKLENSRQLYRLKLVFGLMNVLPDRVQIEEDSEIQRDIKEWKSLLLSKPLDSSVTMIVKDILN